MYVPPETLELWFPSRTVRLSKPKELPSPTWPNNPPGPDYLKELHGKAGKAEQQGQTLAAGYLYGLLYKTASNFFPNGSSTTLHAQVKLGHHMFKATGYLPADKISKDALALAEKLQERNSDSSLIKYCVSVALSTIESGGRRSFAEGDLEGAKANYEYAADYSTKLLGTDHTISKNLSAGLKLCVGKLNSQNKGGGAQKGTKLNHTKTKNKDKNKDGLSQDKPSTRGAKSPDGRQGRTSGLLTVQDAAKITSRRSKSVSIPTKATDSNTETTGDAQGFVKRSSSFSARPGSIGHCFDGVSGTNFSDSIPKWAPKIYIPGQKPTNALKKTHDFLTEARGGYPKGSEDGDRRVRIAVLDTGVDLSQLGKRKKRVKSVTCTIPGLENEGEKDDDGHGTNVVNLIFDVAPEVDVYVYRVFKNTDPKEVTSVWVAPAIRQAISAGVDIISLSFGFENRQNEIRAALKEAMAKDILLFAAASNFGGQPPISIAWPARESGVFCVFATDNEGNRYKHNPSPGQLAVRLATFGENIKPFNSKAEDMISISGTSFSTPILAATAALFLDFAMLSAKTHATRFTHLDAIHYYDSIEALLVASSVERDGLHYVKPWSLFQWEDWDMVKIAFKIGDTLKGVHGLYSAKKFSS